MGYRLKGSTYDINNRNLHTQPLGPLLTDIVEKSLISLVAEEPVEFSSDNLSIYTNGQYTNEIRDHFFSNHGLRCTCKIIHAGFVVEDERLRYLYMDVYFTLEWNRRCLWSTRLTMEANQY